MTKETFAKLCSEIKSAVGEESFKSEAYVQSHGWSSRHARTQHANDYKGGVVPGEIKVAMTIRMLAGASYLDLIVSYCIDKSVVYSSFLEVVGYIRMTNAHSSSTYDYNTPTGVMMPLLSLEDELSPPPMP